MNTESILNRYLLNTGLDKESRKLLTEDTNGFSFFNALYSTIKITRRQIKNKIKYAESKNQKNTNK